MTNTRTKTAEQVTSESVDALSLYEEHGYRGKPIPERRMNILLEDPVVNDTINVLLQTDYDLYGTGSWFDIVGKTHQRWFGEGTPYYRFGSRRRKGESIYHYDIFDDRPDLMYKDQNTGSDTDLLLGTTFEEFAMGDGINTLAQVAHTHNCNMVIQDDHFFPKIVLMKQGVVVIEVKFLNSILHILDEIRHILGQDPTEYTDAPDPIRYTDNQIFPKHSSRFIQIRHNDAGEIEATMYRKVGDRFVPSIYTIENAQRLFSIGRWEYGIHLLEYLRLLPFRKLKSHAELGTQYFHDDRDYLDEKQFIALESLAADLRQQVEQGQAEIPQDRWDAYDTKHRTKAASFILRAFIADPRWIINSGYSLPYMLSPFLSQRSRALLISLINPNSTTQLESHYSDIPLNRPAGKSGNLETLTHSNRLIATSIEGRKGIDINDLFALLLFFHGADEQTATIIINDLWYPDDPQILRLQGLYRRSSQNFGTALDKPTILSKYTRLRDLIAAEMSVTSPNVSQTAILRHLATIEPYSDEYHTLIHRVDSELRKNDHEQEAIASRTTERPLHQLPTYQIPVVTHQVNAQFI